MLSYIWEILLWPKVVLKKVLRDAVMETNWAQLEDRDQSSGHLQKIGEFGGKRNWETFKLALQRQRGKSFWVQTSQIQTQQIHRESHQLRHQIPRRHRLVSQPISIRYPLPCCRSSWQHDYRMHLWRRFSKSSAICCTLFFISTHWFWLRLSVRSKILFLRLKCA